MIQAAFHSASEDEPDRALAVIRPTTGVLANGPTELRTGQYNHVAHQRSKVRIERPDSSGELCQFSPLCQGGSTAGSLFIVRVPSSDVDRGYFEPQSRTNDVRHITELFPIGRVGIYRAVLGSGWADCLNYGYSIQHVRP